MRYPDQHIQNNTSQISSQSSLDMDHCAEDPLGPSIPNHDANACIEKRMVSEKLFIIGSVQYLI